MADLDPASEPFKVFISYRRSDAAGHARGLHRELSRRFDENFAFFDRAGIDVGDDFPERLRSAIEGCVVALVTVGPGWLDARAADGLRRLDNPADFVRIEVALALVRGKVVIPVLLDDASMPSAHELPGPLQALARCDAFVLRGKAYEYERQLEDLVKQLAQRTGVAPRRENVGIAIDVGDSVALYRHVEYLPVRLRAPLRDAFRPLIEDRQRHFGGRRSAIDRLMAFIGGPHAGYCVVSAPAGFGKTALSASLVVGAGGSIAFHFFTPLYGEETLSEAFFLKSVLEQMAAWRGEMWELPPTLDELRAAYQRAIDSPLAGTGVLVLDGIDEVRGWSLAPYLSRTLQTGLRVIVTVRDVGQNWRGEYRFPPAQLLHVELDGLDRAGVGAVLSAVDRPGAELGQSERMRDAVFALAGGDDRQSRGADPFYVRFLAEDLDAGRLTAATLTAAPRGLEAYLDQWWREIRELAGDAPVRDLFGMLTVAVGALSRAELEALQPSLVDEWLADRFEEVLARVRRVVVRDAAGGYSLIHPRLREFMQRRIRIEAYRERLLAYCRDWRSGSCYALSYLGLHLAEADDWSALRALVATESGGHEFLQRRYSAEGSHAGYLRDLERMWQHAEQATRSDTGALADVMRCALVASSLRSMSGRLVPGMVAAAVRHGLWQVTAALDHASEMPDPVLRASAFGALMPWMSEAQHIRACESIVATVQAMRPDARRPPIIVIEGAAPPVRDLDRRGDVLRPLAAVLPEGLVDVVLPIVRSLDRPDQIPVLLAALACAVPPPKRQALTDEAFAAVERIKPRSLNYNPMVVPPSVRKARSLVAMAGYLDEPQRADAYRMALERALQAPRGRSVDALVELLPKWPNALAEQVIDHVLERLDAVGSRALEVLSSIAAHPAAVSRRERIIAELRSRMSLAEDDEAFVEGQVALLSLQSESEAMTSMDALMERSAAIDDEDDRSRIFAWIAARTSGPWREQALRAAADAAAQIDYDDESWATAALRLIPLAGDALMRRLLHDAANREDKHRVQVLNEIAPFLGKDSFVEAFALGAVIADGLRSDALPPLTDAEVEWKSDEDGRDDDDDFPDPYAIERPQSLKQARAITFDLERTAGLVLVASSVEGAQRRSVLEEAFAEALRINDRQRRQQALRIVARGLKEMPREHLVELCLQAVRKGASRSRFELVSDLVALQPMLKSVDAVSATMTPAIVGEIASWLF